MNPLRRRGLAFLLGSALLGLAGCSVVDRSPTPSALDRNARWVLLPFANHTETPLAGQRAEAITESLLRGGGMTHLTRYPASLVQETLFETNANKVQEQAFGWAREQGARYAVSGAVDEWRYKVGVDGEPAVGVMIQVTDLSSGAVVWSSVGGKSGWARESLAGVAQKLIGSLLQPLLAAP